MYSSIGIDMYIYELVGVADLSKDNLQMGEDIALLFVW